MSGVDWNVDKLLIKRGISTLWESQNPVLGAGEFGLDITNNVLKIGNGVDAWDRLPFFISSQMFRKKLADCTWNEINAVAESGLAPMYFSVGDEKDVTLSTNEVITVVIMGFNHDTKTTGGKASITFGTKNAVETTYSMNPTNTNMGGWKASVMRSSVMASYLSYLPSEVRLAVKPVNKITSAGSQSSTLETTSDSLFLFSHGEVFGTYKYNITTTFSIEGEGEQYDYFKKNPIPKPNSGSGKFSALVGNTGTFFTAGTSVASGYVNMFNTSKSTNANRYYNYGNAKDYGNSSTTARAWWLRSPYRGNSTQFIASDATGYAYYYNATIALGCAFGFCV